MIRNGQYLEALDSINNNLIGETRNDVRCDAYLMAATACQYLGRHRTTGEYLDHAYHAVDTGTDDVRKVLVRIRLSDYYLTIGKRDRGEEFAFQALQAADAIENQDLLTEARGNWANVLILYGDYQEAIAEYENILQSVPDSGSRDMKIRIQLNLVKAAIMNNQLDKALSIFVQIDRDLEKLSDSFVKTSLLTSTGAQGLELLNKDLSRDRREQVQSITWKMLNEVQLHADKTPDARLQSLVYGYLGRLYELEQRLDEAVKLTNAAIFHAQQGNHRDLLYQWQWQAGRLARHAGKISAAIGFMENSVNTLGAIRNELTTGYRHSSDIFATRIKPIYYDLADIYVGDALNFKNTDAYQHRLKQACDVIERLKSAELEDYFQDECVVALQQKVRSLEALEVKSTAVIYPLILNDRLVTIVVFPDGRFHHHIEPVDTDRVNHEVSLLRRELQSRSTKLFMYPARTIYDWIIRPFKSELQSAAITTLVIVPDGVLRLIPFSTLHDGEHFLVEGFGVATTPSLKLTDPRSLHREGAAIMIAGLSRSVQGFSALPSVPQELKEIQNLIGGKTMLNEEFSAEAVYAHLKSTSYRIIHLATHGEFGGSPEDTYLLTYDKMLTLDKLEALIKLGQFRDDPVELLTLSACRTAVGDEKSALGLAGVAVKSGARSAIATLWYVNDEATMIAITEFYRQLKLNPSLTKAEALQNAQKKLIATDRYWHPAYWGPFLLIGNWL